jgi:hypothetical protein
MNKWNYTLQLKDLLTDGDINEEELRKLNAAFSSRINSFIKNNQLNEDLAFELQDLGEEFRLCESIGEFNCVLDGVYDVCDEHRVWVK